MNQWLLEVLPGVFVGRITARVRDYLWQELSGALVEQLGAGAYAAVIRQTDDREQGFDIETVGEHDYRVAQHLGVLLIERKRHDGGGEGKELEGLPW